MRVVSGNFFSFGRMLIYFSPVSSNTGLPLPDRPKAQLPTPRHAFKRYAVPSIHAVSS
jgi:hypothetical protein